MVTPKTNDGDLASDNWIRHADQLKEYARIHALRGGKSIHQLVAEAHATKWPSIGRRWRWRVPRHARG